MHAYGGTGHKYILMYSKRKKLVGGPGSPAPFPRPEIYPHAYCVSTSHVRGIRK